LSSEAEIASEPWPPVVRGIIGEMGDLSLAATIG